MRKQKRYAVVCDNQGGEFGMYRLYTLAQWREQTIEWADSDENFGIIKELKKLPKKDIIAFISEYWDLKFEEIDINRWTWDYKTNEIVFYNQNEKRIKELFILKDFTKKDYDNLPKEDYECLEELIERLNNNWWAYEENNKVETTIFD